MKKGIIPNQRDKYNEINRLVSEMATESEEKLVRFAYLKGHSLNEIGAALGVTRQAISQKYPELNPAYRKKYSASDDNHSSDVLKTTQKEKIK